MTTQFLFFLSDVTIWILIGYFFGRVINASEVVSKKKRGRNSMLLISVALLSGCWSVLTRGLPEHSISLHSIAMVAVTLLGTALIKSPRFREKVILQSAYLINMTINSRYGSLVSHQLDRIKGIQLPR